MPQEYLTSEDLDVLISAFTEFDKDGNGAISSGEVGEIVKSLGKVPTAAEIQTFLQKADRDGSGLIDFNEFCITMKNLGWVAETREKNAKKHREKDPIRDVFELLDTDGDEYLLKEEMSEAVKRLHLDKFFSKSVVDKIFCESDLNGDGKISLSEFKLALSSSY